MNIKEINVGDPIICIDGWHTTVHSVWKEKKCVVVKAFEGELRYIYVDKLRRGKKALVQVE